MTYTVYLTDDWLPLPEALLKLLGWRDDDRISIEYIYEPENIGPPMLLIKKVEDKS